MGRIATVQDLAQALALAEILDQVTAAAAAVLAVLGTAVLAVAGPAAVADRAAAATAAEAAAATKGAVAVSFA